MKQRIADYKELLKFSLSALVVFSSLMGYLYAVPHPRLFTLIVLTIGGFLVTASSNGFNQIIEIETDKLMNRTQNRPLPNMRMSMRHALLVSLLMGVCGVLILTAFTNLLTGILSGCALVLYTFFYTPSKKFTPFAVFIGAIPGALPPMLGYVAATGRIDLDATLLFCLQFIWQFPHFWAIAWLLHDDYKKAGFHLLPSAGGRDKRSAYQIVIYTLSLIPIGLLFFYFHKINLLANIVIAIAGFVFFVQSLMLLVYGSHKAARRLMFGSFIYLTVVQIALVMGRIF